jgi:hypothetical protein
MKAAAKKPDTFLATVDQYYEVWTQSNITGMTSAAAVATKQSHADESKRLLVDVSGFSTTATLPGNVTELVATWDDRAMTLTTNLMGSI